MFIRGQAGLSPINISHSWQLCLYIYIYTSICGYKGAAAGPPALSWFNLWKHFALLCCEACGHRVRVVPFARGCKQTCAHRLFPSMDAAFCRALANAPIGPLRPRPSLSWFINPETWGFSVRPGANVCTPCLCLVGAAFCRAHAQCTLCPLQPQVQSLSWTGAFDATPPKPPPPPNTHPTLHPHTLAPLRPSRPAFAVDKTNGPHGLHRTQQHTHTRSPGMLQIYRSLF